MKLVVSENEVARMRFWKENWSKPNLKESDCNYDWGQIPMLHFTVDWKQLCLVFYTTTTTPPPPPTLLFRPYSRYVLHQFLSVYPVKLVATERRVGRQGKFSLQRHQSLFYQCGENILGDDAWEPVKSTNNAPLLCCRLENFIDVISTMVQWRRRLLGALHRCYVAWLYKCIILIITVLLFVSITL